MLWPDVGSLLHYWMRRSLKHSLRRVRSNSRLYQALAERETDETTRELYLLLAVNERRRAMRNVERLFRMRERLPADRDWFATRAWRRVLIACGPRVTIRWIEWRESQELTLIIAAARVATRLTTVRAERRTRPV